MRYSVFLFLFFIPFITSAQKNFRPGYIVNLKGDTTAGLINYKEWGVSPTSILFKPTSANAIGKEYGINDIRFFSITGSEDYRRCVTKISLHPAKLNNISGRDTSWKIDTVFLKIIHNSKLVSLLSYTDNIKERFYILEKGQSQPTELIMREYLGEDGVSLIKETLYKNQLKNLLYAQGTYNTELGGEIEEAAYEEGDLKRIAGLMSKLSNEEQAEERKTRRTYWFAEVGLQHEAIIFKGDHLMSRHPNVSHSSWLPRISAGLDLFANPTVGKVFYRLEAGYQVNKSTLTTTISDDVKAVYSLSGSTVSLRALINYTVYNSDKLKIPLAVGPVYSLTNYSKNEYKKVYANGQEDSFVENWLELRKGITTFLVRGSIVFKNKIEASFLYRPTAPLTKTVAYSMGTNNTELQVYYLFRKKK
jgi:hypothetical protein